MPAVWGSAQQAHRQDKAFRLPFLLFPSRSPAKTKARNARMYTHMSMNKISQVYTRATYRATAGVGAQFRNGLAGGAAKAFAFYPPVDRRMHVEVPK